MVVLLGVGYGEGEVEEEEGGGGVEDWGVEGGKGRGHLIIGVGGGS